MSLESRIRVHHTRTLRPFWNVCEIAEDGIILDTTYCGRADIHVSMSTTPGLDGSLQAHQDYQRFAEDFVLVVVVILSQVDAL